MTFTEIVTEIADRLNLTSSTATTRLGRAVNRLYREVGTSIGLSFVRQTNTSKVVSIGNPEVTFTATEKVLQVWTIDEDGNPTILDEVMLPELREAITPSSDEPKRWALRSVASNTVTIRLDRSPATAYTIYAEVIAEVTDLSGSDAPTFPESFHDILVEGVLKDEYRKLEKIQLARDSEASFQRRLSDLRMFIAKSQLLSIRQGEKGVSDFQRTSSGGTASFGSTALTITGAWTFNEDITMASGVTIDGIDLSEWLDQAVKTTSSPTFVSPIASTSLIIGAASTSGIRLDLESGTLAIREGDDSLYAPLKALSLEGTVSITSPLIIGSTAVIVGASSTDGIRLDIEAGVLAVREGDDSAYGSLKALSLESTTSTTVGSSLTVSGFATHTFSAGGTGANVLAVRNTTAGTGNSGQVRIGNDADPGLAQIAARSSTYTTGTYDVQAGVDLAASGSGGLSLAATHASGAIRFYTGGTAVDWTLEADGDLVPNGGNNYDIGDATNYLAALYALNVHSGSATDLTLNANGVNREIIFQVNADPKMRLLGGGILAIGDNSNANMTVGLTINQGGNADEILALKSSDVAHGMTDRTETDTFGTLRKAAGATGGVECRGFTEDSIAVYLACHYTNDVTGKTTSNGGAAMIDAFKKSGTTSGAPGADANLLVIAANSVTRFLFDNEGSAHADVEWTTFDTHDDLALLDTLDAKMNRRDAVTNAFGDVLRYNAEALQEAGIVNFYDDGPRAMVNTTRLAMLHTGALRQLGRMIQQERAEKQALQSRIDRLEQKLLES